MRSRANPGMSLPKHIRPDVTVPYRLPVDYNILMLPEAGQEDSVDWWTCAKQGVPTCAVYENFSDKHWLPQDAMFREAREKNKPKQEKSKKPVQSMRTNLVRSLLMAHE